MIRLSVLVFLWLMPLFLPPCPAARAQSTELFNHFKNFQSLYKAGKTDAAIKELEQLVRLAKKEFGPAHRLTLAQSNNLASLYQARGRYTDAEKIYKNNLQLFESLPVPDEAGTATTLNNLAGLYQLQGHYRDAEPLYRRALALRTSVLGPNHHDTAGSLNNLAVLLQAEGRYGEALDLYKRSLQLLKRAPEQNRLQRATALDNLGEIYRVLGDYKKAEPLFQRALSIRRKTSGADHVDVAASYNNLAGLREAQGRLAEAERLYKKALDLHEKKRGPDHPDVATSLNNLAALYQKMQRYDQAAALFGRALRIRTVKLGKAHPLVAASVNNLALFYLQKGKVKQAEQLFRHALQIWEKALGPDHPRVAVALNNPAALMERQKRFDEAAPLYRRSLKIREISLGRHHNDVAASLNNLAGLLEAQGHRAEAEKLYRRSLAIWKNIHGKNHPLLATGYNNLARLYFRAGEWSKATNSWQQATSVLIERQKRGLRQTARENHHAALLTGRKKSEIDRNDWYFTALVKSAWRQAEHQGNRAEASATMFKTVQWAMASKAARALSQMAARQGAGKGDLARLVRERQDRLGTWQILEERMNRARGTGRYSQELARKISATEKRLNEIDRQLAKGFPRYASLSRPLPLDIKTVQTLLGPQEALLMFFDTPARQPAGAETFVWAVTRQQVVWHRAKTGGASLRQRVARLRRELDPSTMTRAPAGRGLAVSSPDQTQEETGFSLQTAHELYSELLAPLEPVISDKKHLLVVATGALTALPLHVLVRAAPDPRSSDDQKYLNADWLVRHHAFTTLPSVASLKALRRIAHNGPAAPETLIGFADPVFARPAAQHTVRRTPETGTKSKSGKPSRGYAAYFKGRNVNLDLLAGSLPQLPGTRAEMLRIAEVLHIDRQSIRLGRKASERAVKTAPLDRYRIVYFATHGLVAGDLQGLGEPALALSLPARAGPVDDGLLTASDISTLKLNADWVVMSACNTAAGDRPGAEALSGLARAFFYAGARTLLVSHWPVGDDAAVKLTTYAFKTLRDHPDMGRAEALRQSMLALLRQGGINAHPTSWAPFVVVGEGG